MTRRINVGECLLEPRAVRLVVDALAALVLHDFALIVELGLGQRLGERAHAVGLEPERELELIRWELLEIVRAVPRCRSIDVRARASARFLEQRPVHSVGDVARALEHHVLEEMREAGLAGALALRADVVHHLDSDYGRRVIDTIDDVESVWERILHVRDFYLRGRLCIR